MSIVRSQKPIGGVVGVTVGNAPYKIGIALQRAIALILIGDSRHLDTEY